MICREDKPVCSWTILLIAAGWFLVALFVGETELLSVLPGPAMHVTLASLTAGLLGVLGISRSFRAWVEQFDLRTLILFHLCRFVGIYFLYLYRRGELPGRFALAAGWGDIVVAIGALLLVVSSAARRSRAIVLAWNAIGLADILLAVTIAVGLAVAERHSMEALTRLPLSFLPTMVVPLIISSHVVIFLRLLRKSEPAQHSSTAEQVLATN